MSDNHRSHTVNGKTYSMILPPPLQAMPLCNRVAILIGPLVGKVGSELKLGGETLTSQAQNLLAPMLNSFGSALQELDPTKLTAILTDAAYAGKLCCDGQAVCSPVDFERHFNANRADLYPALVWCVWESVKDFFPQLEGFIQTARAAAVESLSPRDGARTGGSDDPAGRGSVPGLSSEMEA